MPFSNLLKDKVSLLKKDGTVVHEIKAKVQANKIIINGSDIIIESGDLIQHKVRPGSEDTYEVIDPGFYEEIGAIKAHYQVTHRKLGLNEVGLKTAVNNSSIADNLSMLRQKIKRLADSGE